MPPMLPWARTCARSSSVWVRAPSTFSSLVPATHRRTWVSPSTSSLRRTDARGLAQARSAHACLQRKYRTGYGFHTPKAVTYHEPTVVWLFMIGHSLGRMEKLFGWDPRHQRCWDPIANPISNPDFAPF